MIHIRGAICPKLQMVFDLNCPIFIQGHIQKGQLNQMGVVKIFTQANPSFHSHPNTPFVDSLYNQLLFDDTANTTPLLAILYN